MVDILDMEDIIFEIVSKYLNEGIAHELEKKIITEVSDFVEAQQTIACNNCRGKKFKNLKEPWQVG